MLDVIIRMCAFLFCLVGAATASLGAELNFPGSAEARLNRAKAFEASKDYEQATAAYVEYLKLRPEDDEARGSIARLLSWQGHYDEAVRLYEEILSRHPGDLEVLTALAKIKSWQRQFGEARALYERVLRENQ